MNDQISALLAETHNSLREQLNTAQQHFRRLEQLLETRDSKNISGLTRAARRLRSFPGDWPQVLVDASAPFCERAALFTLQGNSLHLVASSNGSTIEDVPLASAPAFHTAVETSDTVVAVRTPGEMSAPIAAAFGQAASFGQASESKFHLFPVSADGRLVALLYADGRLQPDALELLATLAGLVIESGESRLEKAPHDLVNIAAALASNERDLHLKAQRFARVQVAEIRLYQNQHVKDGRAGRDLYASLKTEIDLAREAYRRVFMDGSDAIPDYLHKELVHTLALGDVELLGPTYPGPLG